MIWSSMHDFWHMGGYGLYVWGSFGATAVLLALEVVLTRRQRQAVLHELRLQQEPQHAEEWQA